MILTHMNELAVSSAMDINIYSFYNTANKSFDVIKTLKGHDNWARDIKLIKKSNDILISCDDKDCRL